MSGAGQRHRGCDKPDHAGVPSLLGQNPAEARSADERPQGQDLHRSLCAHAHGLPHII